MPELRRVTLSREQRDHLDSFYSHRVEGSPVGDIIAAWDAAEPLACPKCDGTGLVPSLEGCGVRVQCRACHGTGLAS